MGEGKDLRHLSNGQDGGTAGVLPASACVSALATRARSRVLACGQFEDGNSTEYQFQPASKEGGNGAGQLAVQPPERPAEQPDKESQLVGGAFQARPATPPCALSISSGLLPSARANAQ